MPGGCCVLSKERLTDRLFPITDHTNMPGLVINPRARIYHGHEWVYGTDVKKSFGEPEPGDVISLKDFRDRSIGSAIYNPHSQIVARRFSRRKQDLDLEFFVSRIERAEQFRQSKGFSGVYRVIWSESDGLPGVILDRYESQFVLQTLTLAMDRRIELISEAIRKVFDVTCLIARNESPVRVAERLELEKRVLFGEPEIKQMSINGVTMTVDLHEGQKTGLYLDQLDNYTAVAKHAKGRRVLDCFCNQAGFALHAAKAGASEVTAIDSSETAIQSATENAKAEELELKFVEANVFDFLKASESESQTYDLIVLDPPSFTRNRKTVKDALRGYKEIHLRALKMLEPGGILSTFCCSHHITRGNFLDVIRDAAVDAKRTIRLVETYAQRADHPVIATLPESEYLRGFSFEVIPAW